MEFIDARHIARMTRKEVADYLKLSLKTINRYEKTGKAPKAVIECLLMIGGHCPTFSLRNDFTNWFFSSGFLYSPEGDKFTSGDVRAGKLALLEMNLKYRAQLRKQQVQHKSNIIQFPSRSLVSTG